MPEIIQDIGTYAGLASVVGLAVLSALYFSQARDVKRLREWAGRAPERAEQGTPAVPGRVVAQPQPAAESKPEPARPAAPPVPGKAPAPAPAAATGARPAAATPAGGKPVPVPAGAAASGQAAAAAGQAAAASGQAGAAAGEAGAATAPAPAGANSKGATQAPAKPPVPVPAGGNAGARPPAPPVPRPPGAPRAVPQSTAVIPPPRQDPWYRRLLASPRYLVLAIAGVLIVGGAAVFGVTQLVSEDTGSGSAPNERAVSGGDGGGGDERPERERRRGGGVNPANVTVAVLNGTTVPGLAATLSDQVEEAGFQEGTIANFLPNQELAESVVQYTPGHEREAAAVSRRLDITQREAANPSSQELAGDATVIVLVGADKAP